ncbi:MAG: ABC transporter permease [Treponema sp.]|nr:ABC transporter permease [Treponema sp.]
MESFFPVLRSAVTIMTPLLFAAAGGLFPALAGVLNIALEGLLLAGAFTSLAVFYYTGSAAASIITAVTAAMLLSLIHAFTAFKLKADLFITGLAVNLLSGGLCIVLSDKLFNTRGVTASSIVFGLVNRYFLAGLILLLLSWLVIYKTPFGYRLRACNKDSEALLSLGIKPLTYKVCAFLISGFFCGLGGSFLSLNLGAFVPGMSAGKGWIALVIIFLGGRKPQGILMAAFIFGLAEAFSNHAQGFWNLPSDIILAFPYIITLIAMIIASAAPFSGEEKN